MITFTAHTQSGSGRGKDLDAPTINLVMEEIPEEIEEGVYACFATLSGERLPATMHYGPRPVFKDIPSCEVHILDYSLEHLPESLTVEVIERLRAVQDFGSPEALKAQIADDCTSARAILAASCSTDSKD